MIRKLFRDYSCTKSLNLISALIHKQYRPTARVHLVSFASTTTSFQSTASGSSSKLHICYNCCSLYLSLLYLELSDVVIVCIIIIIFLLSMLMVVFLIVVIILACKGQYYTAVTITSVCVCVFY